VSGALAGAAALAALGGSGILVAGTIGLKRASEFGLAVYLIAFAEVVALSLALSLVGALTRAALLAGSAALLAASAAFWLRAGSPRPPAFPREILGTLHSGPLLALAGVAGLAIAYVAALNATTAPNGWDQLNYHLPRAAFWFQSERVGFIEAAYAERINAYPPNGEIAMTFALAVTRHEAFTAFVQLAAALACALAVFALARRVGLERREALFGALLFLIAPIVLLQSATTKNDLVVGAFLLAASVFVLGDSRAELGLAALATALAVGTKVTGLYGVAVLLVLALATPSRGRRTVRVAAVAAGAVLGSYWYAVNAVQTGNLLGDETDTGSLTAPLQPRENLFTAYGLALDAVDLSGAQGRDVLLYLVAGALVAAVLLARRGPTRSLVGAGLAACAVASPLLLVLLIREVGRPGLFKLHQLLGKPDAFLPFDNTNAASAATASASDSWYGPAGVLLAVGVGAAAVVLVRRRRLPPCALVLAAAPLVWLLMLAVTLTYQPFAGRFFVLPAALSAALWGIVLRVRPAAWAAVGLASTTAFLSLVHCLEKPSGLRLLDRSPAASVWRLERWEIQSSHAPGISVLYRFFDEEVPRRDSVALALGDDDFGFQVFGPNLERHVELVPFGSSAADVPARWLLAGPARAGDIEAGCWRRVLTADGGAIFERRAAPGCAVPGG
jgi:hypothetical protein